VFYVVVIGASDEVQVLMISMLGNWSEAIGWVMSLVLP
jgi:hypothetical protein